MPLRRDDILNVLRDGRPMLDAFGVACVSLFGSYVRDEGREDNDGDLLVEFSRPIGDLVTPAALKPHG